MLAWADVHPSAVLIAAALVVAPPVAAAAADHELGLRAELGSGIDTNPERILGEGARAREYALALVQVKGWLEGDRYRLAARLTEGARLYLGLPDASASASRLEATARASLRHGIAAGAAISANDLTERGSELDQDSLHAESSLLGEAGPWSASLSGGWTLFAPRAAPLRAFEASGPEASLRAGWAPARKHTLSAGYGMWWADYPRWGELAPGGRDDRTGSVSAEYAYQGELLAALGYAYSWNRSSAAGGAFERHRVTARGAAHLPGDLTLAVRGSLQWSHYPEPLFIEQQLLLALGQESQDALEARLSHPLWEGLELSLACAFYRNEAVQGGPALGYSRTLLFATVGWRGTWRSPRRPGPARRRARRRRQGLWGRGCLRPSSDAAVGGLGGAALAPPQLRSSYARAQLDRKSP